MAYVGNTPAEAYISISSQTFTTINGTGYVLSSSVTNSEDIALFLNNVRQKPSTYTATGTALTMGTATTTLDALYCVYLGKALQTVNPPAGSVGTTSIADDAVTYAKIQDTTTANRVIGAATAGVVSEVQVVDDMTNFVSTASAPGLTVKGDGSTDGYLQLNCDQNTHGIKLKSPAHSDAQSYTLTFPGTAPAVDKYFKTDASGNLSWVDINVGDIAWQSVVTASTLAAVAGRGYPINTTSNACTVTLPAAASVGDQIIFTDYARNWNTNAVTINQNSLNYQGNSSPNPVYDTDGESVHIVYMDATKGWVPINDGAVALETPQTTDHEYLVVAGGGGGGYNCSGGGGAGGYLTNYGGAAIALTSGVTYTITVGAGGAGDPNAGGTGISGVDSVISGTGITTITSDGGGGGGSMAVNGLTGGSGGGGGGGSSPGTGGAGTAGPPRQGYAGGDGPGGTYYPGGGGGGASEVGDDGDGSVGGGDGGDGTANSITGASVTYAGGAGAGTENGGAKGAGGAGGGGTGGELGVDATVGTNYLGGGGGGGKSGGAGANGGIGIVILRVATADVGTPSGNETIIIDGSDSVIKWHGDGSYVA